MKSYSIRNVVFILLYTHTHTHTHRHRHRHTHTYTHTHARKHARTQTPTHTRTCSHTHTEANTRTRTRTHIHTTHTRTHANTRTHTHRYTHLHARIQHIAKSFGAFLVGGPFVHWFSCDQRSLFYFQGMYELQSYFNEIVFVCSPIVFSFSSYSPFSLFFSIFFCNIYFLFV